MGKTNFSDLQYHIQRNARHNTSLDVLYSGVRYFGISPVLFVCLLVTNSVI